MKAERERREAILRAEGETALPSLRRRVEEVCGPACGRKEAATDPRNGRRSRGYFKGSDRHRRGYQTHKRVHAEQAVLKIKALEGIYGCGKRQGHEDYHSQ